MDDFTSHRWRQRTNANEHKPVDAARAFTHDVEKGLPVKHVIVCYVLEDGAVGYYQAGQADRLGQAGLISSAEFLMLTQGDS